MSKVYVLDTNVLLHDPKAIFAFQENEVVIPAVVVEEIDSKKRYQDEIGRNARMVARILDGLREHGPLHTGVLLESGGLVRVELNHRSSETLRQHFYEATNDNRIIAVVFNLWEEEQRQHNRPVVLVSKDAVMRIKADALGITAQDYLSDKIAYSEFYTGFEEVMVEPGLINSFYTEHGLEAEELEKIIDLSPNQYLILKDSYGSSKSALAFYNHSSKRLQPLNYGSEPVWGIMARNVQQKMALDLLLNDQIPLVTLTGRAGTGKTLLALAAGLLKTQDEATYKKLLVARPIIPMGRDLGFLPGDKEEKLRPWMQPVYDNLEYLFNTKKNGDIDDILAGIKNIQVEALTYIRGRSIPNQFIIVDEAQNLTKHEIKTIISRVGEHSKIVLVGDPEQIDHPYLDATNNGLTLVVERFKAESLAGHVTLIKGERSQLAQLAADLM